MICQILGRALLCEAALLLAPGLVAVIYGEPAVVFWLTAALAGGLGLLLTRFKPRSTVIYAREGFVSVSLSWLLLSLVGCLPFYLSGSIPSLADAIFETVSGFTTTGASILTDVEALGRGVLFWRSLTHWIGGMGVLVFVMAVLPLANSRAMHIMRAEMPGPSVGKLVPRARRTAIFLYLIYIGLTLLEVLALLLCGLTPYDAVNHALSTAGTGGFSTYAASAAVFSPAAQTVIGLFMLLFGVNFNLYFLLLLGQWRPVVHNRELRWYIIIVGLAVLTIAWDIRGLYAAAGPGEGLRHAFFQVGSVITTTGFCTADFNLWPEYSRSLLLLLMLAGACAGSTGGGMKLSRMLLLFKAAAADIKRMLRPSLVADVRQEGRVVDERTLREVFCFSFLYLAILLAVGLLLSLDGTDIVSNFTASLACLSNIGPGLNLVGPMGNYAMFSDASKLLLSLEMLFGRLELWPMIMLFSPSTWRRA